MKKEGHFPLRVFGHLLAFAFGLFASVLLAKPTKLKVFILAGQSNMDGQAHVCTIDFLGEDLDPRVVALTAGGWLPEYDRDFKKDPITEEERAMLARAMSNKGFHYSGEGRFFILAGKAFAETMLKLLKDGR